MSRSYLRRIFTGFIIFFAVLLLYSPSSASASPLINDSLQVLDSDTNWPSFFTANNGQSSNTTHFGAYVFHAVGDSLFIGLANYRPADAGSASLAKFDGSDTTFLGNLNEEGVNEIISFNGTVYLGGADPHDSWALGNVYTYTGSTFTKIRDGNGLSNVIHMWGMDVTDTGILYAAVSSHDGSFPGTCINGVTCFGEVFKSTTNGLTWSSLGELGDYRVFDIKVFGGKLYALYVDDVVGDNRLAVSSNDGASWTTLKDDDGLRRTHLTEFDDKLVMLGNGTSNDMLYAVDASNTITSYTLPFSVGILYGDANHFANYNQFVVSSDDYFYTISSEGDVWRTADLSNWSKVADTSNEFISIGYWPSRNWLLLSTRGASASLFYIDLDENFSSYISGLPSDLEVVDVATDLNAESPSSSLSSAGRTVRITNADGTYISDVTTDLSEIRNWSMITAEADREHGRSVISGLNFAPGASATHTLYIPFSSHSLGTDVLICPNATELGHVRKSCDGGIQFQSNQTKTVGSDTVTVTKIQVGNRNYWKAIGLSGTGGIDVSETSSSSGTSNKKGRPAPVPQVRAQGAAVLQNEGSTVIVEENTVSYDSKLHSSIKPRGLPIHIQSLWQVSGVHELWFTSFSNGARITNPIKPSIISLVYNEFDLMPVGQPVKRFNVNSLKLAHSYDGTIWTIIPSSIVDPINKTVAAIHPVGGYYVIVGTISP